LGVLRGQAVTHGNAGLLPQGEQRGCAVMLCFFRPFGVWSGQSVFSFSIIESIWNVKLHVQVQPQLPPLQSPQHVVDSA
jgi:hypothetical protein